MDVRVGEKGPGAGKRGHVGNARKYDSELCENERAGAPGSVPGHGERQALFRCGSDAGGASHAGGI